MSREADAIEPRVELLMRESERARRLSLQARPPRTVELVVPRGVRPEIVNAFLREHRDWIDRASRALIESCPATELRPERIELKAIGETLSVQYRPASAARRLYFRESSMLVLNCRRADCGDHARILRHWLLDEGRRVLKPWLEREAVRIGLRPGRVQLRLQGTRWGSCSTRGAISLNAALLLVEPALVRYLFVHELAHLEHHGHTERFWRLVARVEPDYRALDRELARSARRLPAWLHSLTRGTGS
jgi:predicted metal-dependent hydrolase